MSRGCKQLRAVFTVCKLEHAIGQGTRLDGQQTLVLVMISHPYYPYYFDEPIIFSSPAMHIKFRFDLIQRNVEGHFFG